MKFIALRAAKIIFSLPVYLMIALLAFYEACLRLMLGVSVMKVRDPVLKWIGQSHTFVQVPKGLAVTKLKLLTPNYINAYRAASYFDKEPEVIEWIDEFGHMGSFFDIGANVGLYSLYYLATQKGTVYSFEPSPFNLKTLAIHLSDNGFSERCNLIPLPLSNSMGFSSLRFGSLDDGGALNAFGVDFDQNGEKFSGVAEITVLGCSIDFLVKQHLIGELPAIIKIDVDGIEHLILQGAISVLSSPSCKSIYVEVNDSFFDQSEGVAKVLLDCGFALREKRKSSPKGMTFNQIWVK